MKPREVFRDLAVDIGAGAQSAPPVAAVTQTLRHRKTDRLPRRRVRIELVDLKCPGQSPPYALVHRPCRDISALGQNASGVGAQDTGQLDDGGLAGAVRPDQRMTRARLDPQRQVAGDSQLIGSLLQCNGFQRDRQKRSPQADGRSHGDGARNISAATRRYRGGAIGCAQDGFEPNAPCRRASWVSKWRDNHALSRAARSSWSAISSPSNSSIKQRISSSSRS